MCAVGAWAALVIKPALLAQENKSVEKSVSFFKGHEVLFIKKNSFFDNKEKRKKCILHLFFTFYTSIFFL